MPYRETDSQEVRTTSTNYKVKGGVKMSNEQEVKFNSINASSLFHYTDEFSTLKLILQNGVRFSYAFERYPKSLISNFCDITVDSDDLGVAIPMASFCDIPITRATNHMGKYGRYFVGFNKSFMIKYLGKILNPLLYVQSPNLVEAINDLSCIYKETSEEHQALVYSGTENSPRIPILGLRMFDLRLLIGLTKPMCSSDGREFFYDEREWRVFNDDNKGQFNEWRWGISEDEFNNKEKKLLNDRMTSNPEGYITINEVHLQEAITHIVVSTEDEVALLAEEILQSSKLFGSIVNSKKVKLSIVSKITSIERISLDY